MTRLFRVPLKCRLAALEDSVPTYWAPSQSWVVGRMAREIASSVHSISFRMRICGSFIRSPTSTRLGLQFIVSKR